MELPPATYKERTMQARSIAVAALAAAGLWSSPAIAQPVTSSKDVNVVNVPTVNVRSGREPVQGEIECVIPAEGASCVQAFYTVPAGKRFVMQQIAVRSGLLPATDHVHVSVQTGANGSPLEGYFPIAVTAVPHTSQYAYYVGTHALTIYADAYASLWLQATAVTRFEKIVGSFSGYLEDAP
jgi:hypothetical protein